jgi:hypothetical protein
MSFSLSVPTARRIRTSSRVAFWISGVMAVVAASFVRIDDPWSWALAAIFVAAALLSLSAYLAALRIGRAQDGREFVAALGGEPGRPIVLFLRSFDVAESTLTRRVLAGVQFLAKVASAIQGDVGSAGLERYEFEEELDSALGARAMFVAIGAKRGSYGSFKLIVKDEEWRDAFQRLAAAARLIVMMPGPSASTLWEMGRIVDAPRLLEKSVFVMPREGSKVDVSGALKEVVSLERIPSQEETSWAALAHAASTELGVALPRYERDGCCFRIGPDRRPSGAIALEAFTHGVRHCGARHADAGGFDLPSVWTAAR